MESVEPDPKQPEAEICRDWAEIIQAFESFLPTPLSISSEGEVGRNAWIFRGLKSADYGLEPSIERAITTPEPWAVFEPPLLREFQSRAQLYASAYDLPPKDDKVSWLALMQHSGVPTRLLDFTDSPYVALYFALRSRTEKEKESSAKVWAIDGEAVMKAALRISGGADSQEEDAGDIDANGDPIAEASPVAASLAQNLLRYALQFSHQYRTKVVDKALEATGVRKRRFDQSGFVALALPSAKNLRLSSQQGVFLFNGAQGLTFSQSLFRMMASHQRLWCRLFQIPASELSEIERRLFQMNIHDLALFPDMEGLAGFIKQKIQLHWLAEP